MNFTVNKLRDTWNATLHGSIVETYTKLLSIYGEPKKYPMEGDTYFQWEIQYEDGAVVVIYNRFNVLDENQMESWYICGRDVKDAVKYVKKTLKDK